MSDIRHKDFIEMANEIRNRATAGHDLSLADLPKQLSCGVYDATTDEHLLIHLTDLKNSINLQDEEHKKTIYACLQTPEGKRAFFNIKEG